MITKTQVQLSHLRPTNLPLIPPPTCHQLAYLVPQTLQNPNLKITTALINLQISTHQKPIFNHLETTSMEQYMVKMVESSKWLCHKIQWSILEMHKINFLAHTMNLMITFSQIWILRVVILLEHLLVVAIHRHHSKYQVKDKSFECIFYR